MEQKTVTERAMDYLRANPMAKNREVMAALRCSSHTVYTARQRCGVRSPQEIATQTGAEHEEKMRNELAAYLAEHPRATLRQLTARFGVSHHRVNRLRSEVLGTVPRHSGYGAFDMKDIGPNHDRRTLLALRLPITQMASAFTGVA